MDAYPPCSGASCSSEEVSAILALCESEVHAVRDKIANGGNFIYPRHCLDLSLKLSKIVQIVRELVSCCGGLDAGCLRLWLDKFLRCLARAKVLVSRCCGGSWATAVFLLSPVDFSQILDEIAFWVEIFESVKSEEWSDRPQYLRQSSVFLPTPLSDVLADEDELRKRLERLVNEPDGDKSQGWNHALARALLERMGSEESKANTSETSGHSCFLGFEAAAEIFMMANYWRGVDVAKKAFHGQESELDYLKEASTLGNLCHPNIASFFCCGNGQERGGISTVMDEDLIMSCKKNRWMGIRKGKSLLAVDLMMQIGVGSSLLHRNHIGHRDLKPANVLVNCLGSRPYYHATLVDFGLSMAKSLDVDAQRALHTQDKILKNDAYDDISANLIQTCSSGKVVMHDLYREFAKSLLEMRDMELERSQMARSILNHDGPVRKTIPSRSWSDEETQSLLESRHEAVRVDAGPHIWDYGPVRKRIRSRSWSDEETQSLLESRLEAIWVDAGRHIWDYVSGILFKQKGFDRASKSCHEQWDILHESFNTIDEHESKIKSGTSNCVSYWEMDEDERSKNKLPQAFYLEWYEIMERILTATSEDEKTGTSSDLPLGQSQLDAGNLDSADGDEVLLDESEVKDVDTESEDEEVSGDSTTTIESQAGDSVCGYIPVQANPTCEADYETNSKYAGRKRSAATVMEDDLISILAPFVNKQIEDALKPLLSALRSPGEDEQKHRQKLLAMVEENEKMLF